MAGKRKNSQDIKIKIEKDEPEIDAEVTEDKAPEEEAPPEEKEAEEAEEKAGTEEPETGQEEGTSEEASEETSDKEAGESEAGQKEEDKFGKDGKIHSGLFDKKKKKKDPMAEKVADLEDRVKRQMAEFENFRRRTEKEKTQMYDMGAKTVIEKILPVIDNFERGLDGAPDDAFAEGMQMIYKQIKTVLEDMDVKEIEAQGKEFDPELHNAVMHVDDDQYGENEVVEVLQKGYIYHDTVVRHSMVKVAN